MKDWISKSSISLVLLVIFVLILLLIPKAVAELEIISKDTNLARYNIQFATLFPADYKYPEITQTPAVLSLSTSKITPTKLPKVKKAKAIPKPKPTPEIISSTIEGRDADRQIYAELLSEKINEYLFHYDILPELYSDKSETLLTSNPSDSVYFYNGKENKTNAIGLKIVADTYLLNQVNTCEQNFSSQNRINFVYDKVGQQVVLCGENEKKQDFEFGL